MIEKDYDVSFVAAIALREKQIQQNLSLRQLDTQINKLR